MHPKNAFDGKLPLLLAGYNAAHCRDASQRQELCRALFWLCDEMKEDVRLNVPSESQPPHLGTLHRMQALIERGFFEAFPEEADVEFAALLTYLDEVVSEDVFSDE